QPCRLRLHEELSALGRDYCGRTTLHGLKYVGDQELHIVERVFWLIVFLIALVAAVYYILFLYDKWKENPMIVSLSPYATKITEIPFPAVTVCNMNRAKKSVVDEILLKGSELENNLLKDLCDINVTKGEDKKSNDLNVTGHWDTVQNFLVKVGQPCHELLHVCRYGGSDLKCSDNFNPSLTDEGICCSFNKQVDWTPETGFPPHTPSSASPMRPVGVGVHLGLSLVLDAQVDEYYCSTTASVGFK
ncbi:Pickpocket protein 28, partial [Gryllus bimaculatus]